MNIKKLIFGCMKTTSLLYPGTIFFHELSIEIILRRQQSNTVEVMFEKCK